MSSSQLPGLPPLSLAMIVRDCAEDLKIALASIHEHVDEIVIVDTAPEGSKDGTREVALSFGAKLYDFPWIDDFAAARNFSFEKCTNDLVMWLDSDDEVIGGHQICEDAKLVFASGINQIQVRYDYRFDKNGKCRLRQMRERIVDRTVHEWRSPIHECLCATYTYKQGVLNPALGYIKHRSRLTPESVERSDIRNLRICEKMEKEGTLETRTLYYYAQALKGAQRIEEALEMFMRYVPLSGNRNERYDAMVQAAWCNHVLKRSDACKKMLSAAIVEYPQLPLAYLDMAEVFMTEHDLRRTFEWADETILHQKGMDGQNVADPAYLMGRPHLIKAWVLHQQSQFRKAQEELQKAEEHLGDDPDVITMRDELNLIESYSNDLKAFVDLSQALEREGRHEDAQKLAILAPKSIETSPPVTQLLPRERPSDRPTVAFVCPHNWEFWGPDGLEKGIGGSEEAVIHVTRGLVKEGFHVEVYAHTKARTQDHGVQWFPTYMFDGSADAVISWRHPNAPIDFGLKAKASYLWLHDVPQRDAWIKDFDLLYDRVITLSDYHRSLYDFVPDHMIFPWGNGIDVASLPTNEAEPGRLIYASCPTRGLLNILKFWRYIRDQVPGATLHTYYGWNAVALEHKKQNPMMERIYQEVERLKGQDGVHWHGRVGQPELHEAFSRSQMWVYPTDFCVTGDTLVDMPRDYTKHPRGVPISELVGRTGDLVWTVNESNGRFELKPIQKCWKSKENAEIVRVIWDDGTSLHCTPDHKVLTYKRGWIEAKDLKNGESVVSLKKHAQVHVSSGEGPWRMEHRKAAEAIFGKIPPGYHVDHIDGNSLNNTPSNLQLLSPAEHAKKTFTGIPRLWTHLKRAGFKAWAKSEEGQATLKRNNSRRSKKFWDSMTKEERASFTSKRAEKVRSGRWNHKVIAVESAGFADVYDMAVEGNHNFIAGGVVVHNCEISCITAMKAQALGAMPLYNNHAALKETVRFGESMPDVHMDETRNQKAFADLVIKHLQDPGLFTQRQEMMAWARSTFSWDARVKELAAMLRADLLSACEEREIVRGRMPRRSLVSAT